MRANVCGYMSSNSEHFSPYIPETERFKDYVVRKSHDGVFGNNPEIAAASELYNRKVLVYTEESWPEPMNTFQGCAAENEDEPIRLSYHDGNHYNAIINPFLPTAGLGLGLPGLKPGLADEMQLAEAKTLNDSDLTDELLKRKIMALTDEEETEREMERYIMMTSGWGHDGGEQQQEHQGSNKRQRSSRDGGKPSASDQVRT